MREILFRGKLKSKDEWAFGNLNVNVKGVCVISPDETVIGKYGRVIPETVGQYTGLTDKNGTKIFEGDIVKGAWNTVFVVYYDKDYLQFRAKPDNGYAREIDYYGDSSKIEIIGNIHDNPDLLSEV